MTQRKRRTYTEEFKRDAVNLASQPGNSFAQAARNLWQSENLLPNWKKKTKTSASELSENERLELARLREENKRLWMKLETRGSRSSESNTCNPSTNSLASPLSIQRKYSSQYHRTKWTIAGVQ